MRVAVCLSGYADVIALPAYQRHLLAAFMPLRSDASVTFELLLHLDGTLLHESEKHLLLKASQTLDAAELKVYNSTPTRPNPVPGRVMCRPDQLSKKVACDCLTVGYIQNVKLRGCLASIKAREAAMSAPFDLVVRMRSDIEFGFSVPAAAQWARLREGIVWAGMVEPRSLLGLEEVGLIDDQFAVLPRAIAAAYLSGPADDIEACVPAQPDRTEQGW